MFRFYPGDRAKRWRRGQSFAGIIELGIAILGVATILGGNPVFGGIFAIWGFTFAFIDFRSAKRGWKIDYSLPPRAYREMDHPSPIRRDMARRAAARTLERAKDPDRPHYAFEDPDVAAALHRPTPDWVKQGRNKPPSSIAARIRDKAQQYEKEKEILRQGEDQ